MVMKLSKYDTAIKQTREQIPGELRELLGEIKDPIKQYMRTAAKINTYIADTNFFNTLLKKGKGKKKGGGTVGQLKRQPRQPATIHQTTKQWYSG